MGKYGCNFNSTKLNMLDWTPFNCGRRTCLVCRIDEVAHCGTESELKLPRALAPRAGGVSVDSAALFPGENFDMIAQTWQVSQHQGLTKDAA